MSTSQPQAAPQATEAPAAPANTQDTISPSPPLPARSLARPTGATNANADAHVNPTLPHDSAIAAGAPTPGPNTTPAAAPPATATDESLSLNDRLNAGDRYWKFKFGLMTILVITGLVGIGCFGWLITSDPDDRSYGYGSYWTTWPCLVTWSVSIAWCAACAAVFIARKRPVHPGVRVSVELLLWLAFILTALCALLSLQNLNDFGLYGGPDGWNYDYTPSAGGDYVLASNNTWVWKQDTSYISTPRNCTSSLSLASDVHFKDCAEQDAFVNKLWAEKPHRVSVALTGVVCQFFGLGLHLALFIWACIDTHQHRLTKISRDAEKMAAGIVQSMISNGAIIPPPGQARVSPGAPHGMFVHVPTQGYYPTQPIYMQPTPMQQPQYLAQQQYMVPAQYPIVQQGAISPAPGVAGPSNEKTSGPRYA